MEMPATKEARRYIKETDSYRGTRDLIWVEAPISLSLSLKNLLLQILV